MKNFIFICLLAIFYFPVATSQEIIWLQSTKDLKLEAATKVVLLGDQAHGDDLSLKNVKAIMRAISASDRTYNCYFAELSPEYNRPIEDYLKSKKSYQESVMNQFQALTDTTGLKTQNILPAFLLDEARLLGWSVYGIDFQMDSKFGQEFFAWIKRNRTPAVVISEEEALFKELKIVREGRNEIMAAQIAHHLKSGACKKGATFVGTGHMRTNYRGHTLISLQDFLQKGGVKHEIYVVPKEELK